jgi:hypothetical protein
MPKNATTVESKKEDKLDVSAATNAVTETTKSFVDYFKDFKVPDSLKDFVVEVGKAAGDAALEKVVTDFSDTTKYTDIHPVVKQIAVAMAKQGRSWLHGGVVAGSYPDVGPRDESGNVKK